MKLAGPILIVCILTAPGSGAANPQVIDLIERAPSARWEATGQGDLVFGKDQRQASLVDYRYRARLADGKVYPRTLYTPVHSLDYATTLRGRFRLRLPRAERIRLVASVHGEQNWMHRVAIGYATLEKPFRVTYLREIQPQGILKGVGADFDEDVTFLAGQEVELVLRTQAEASSTAGLLHWTRAQVVCDLPDGAAAPAHDTLPPRPAFIKRIEGLPRPWKARALRVVPGDGTGFPAGCRLSYTLTDLWGNRLAQDRPVALAPGGRAAVVELHPLLRERLGWFQAEFALKRHGAVADTQSISLSRIPPRPAERSPIVGLNQQFWLRALREVALDLEMVKDSGVRYVRCNGPEHLAELAAQGNGEYVLWYIAHGYLDRIRKEGWTAEVERQCHEEAFRFVRENRGRVRVYELGNEFNTGVSPEDCARIYRTVGAAARAADPGCTVNTVGAGGGGPGVVEWFDKLYALAGDQMDNLSLHPYTFTAPDVDDYLAKRAPQALDDYFGILRKHGAPARKGVFCTEYGWFAYDAPTRHDQARYVVRQYLLGAARGVPMMPFILKDSGYDTAQGVCSAGLATFSREPKPAFAALAVTATMLGGARFVRAYDIGPNAFCYAFRKRGKDILALWRSKGAGETLLLPSRGRSVLLTDLVGGTRQLKASPSGAAAVPLSSYPHWVEGIDVARLRILGRHPGAEPRTPPAGPSFGGLAGEQLLANAGFERASPLGTVIYSYKGWTLANGLVPDGWCGLPNWPGTIEVAQDGQAHSGKAFVRVTPGGDGAPELFSELFHDTRPGEAFALSVWARGSGKASLLVYEYGDDHQSGVEVCSFPLGPEWARRGGTPKCKRFRFVLKTLPGAVADFDDLELVKLEGERAGV